MKIAVSHLKNNLIMFNNNHAIPFFFQPCQWSIETSHSKMYKLITVRKDMTSKEFMEKISKLFNINLSYFSVGYSLPQNPEM